MADGGWLMVRTRNNNEREGTISMMEIRLAAKENKVSPPEWRLQDFLPLCFKSVMIEEILLVRPSRLP